MSPEVRSSVPARSVYENDVFGAAANGQSLHPGDLDLTRRMLDYCQLSEGARLLDAACGTGATVEDLTARQGVFAIGLDRSELLLQTGLLRNPSLALVCAWGKSMPVASAVLDVILAECSLSAMAEPALVLAEFQRVLRRGGLLALSDIYARRPEGLPLLQSLPLACGLRDALSQPELERLLHEHGFEIQTWEDHSGQLQDYSAQAVRKHGSASAFWQQAEPEADPLDVLIAVSRARLGYYLLIARKV